MPARCDHTATGHGFSYRCDLPAGHEGLHAQHDRLRGPHGSTVAQVTNWGDDGLAPHATAGRLPQRRTNAPPASV